MMGEGGVFYTERHRGNEWRHARWEMNGVGATRPGAEMNADTSLFACAGGVRAGSGNEWRHVRFGQ